MSSMQKILVVLACTLSLTCGVLLAWHLNWFDEIGVQPTTVQVDTSIKTPPPAPALPVIVPGYLAGNVQPLTTDGSDTDVSLQEDPYRMQQERKASERYLENLKTAKGRVIGAFQTSLAGHNASGRVKNIELACQKLNGSVLLPGEILSFNDVLGDSNDPNGGWQLATVIVGNEFVDGYGGGICQVSTTLYNSVLNAGLEVRERYTHSLPVGYVQPGLDATVSYPELDFRFRNSSNAPVRVETQVTDGLVISKLLALPQE